MAFSSIRKFRRVLILVGLLLVMLIAGSSIALGGSMVSTTAITPHIPGVTPLLSYQGRLVTPGTGAPKPDGTYEMSFRLYTVATGGTALWTETRDVQVSGGVFSVLLGEVTALDAGHFNGQVLWLGIKVGTDAEATPRQHLAHVAYALFAENTALLNGKADTSFAASSHAHSGGDITTGTVADGRVAPTLARDSEVFSLVTGADGAGSGLDADLLDGQDSAFYRNATNINAGTLADARIPATLARDSEVFGLVTGADGTGSGLDADLLDGLSSNAFASATHTHKGVDIVDGSIGTVDLEDGAVTSAKIANGSVSTVDLANGAVTADKIASNVLHHYININPTSINMDTADGVSFITGFGPNAGVRLPNANTPSIDFGFIVPSDYTAGAAMTLRIVWHTASTNCGIVLAPNYVSVARAGRSHLVGGGAASGITAVGGDVLKASSVSNRSEAKSYSLTSPDSSTTLQAGDSFIVGLYRSASNTSDTCTGDLKIQGIQILY